MPPSFTWTWMKAFWGADTDPGRSWSSVTEQPTWWPTWQPAVVHLLYNTLSIHEKVKTNGQFLRSTVVWTVSPKKPVFLLTAELHLAAGKIQVNLNFYFWILSWLPAFMVPAITGFLMSTIKWSHIKRKLYDTKTNTRQKGFRWHHWFPSGSFLFCFSKFRFWKRVSVSTMSPSLPTHRQSDQALHAPWWWLHFNFCYDYYWECVCSLSWLNLREFVELLMELMISRQCGRKQEETHLLLLTVQHLNNLSSPFVSVYSKISIVPATLVLNHN